MYLQVSVTCTKINMFKKHSLKKHTHTPHTLISCINPLIFFGLQDPIANNPSHRSCFKCKIYFGVQGNRMTSLMLLNHGGDAERSSTRVSSVPGAATWRHAAARSKEQHEDHTAPQDTQWDRSRTGQNISYRIEIFAMWLVQGQYFLEGF